MGESRLRLMAVTVHTQKAPPDQGEAFQNYRGHTQRAGALLPESVILGKPGVVSGSVPSLRGPPERPFMLAIHKPRREKVFGEGRPVPLDRNAKARIMTLARALSHPTEKGKHYGVITAKFLNVLEALIWGFHNARSGLCFPSYETIAARAGCTRSTVYEAIHALEDVGILTWVNRIKRIREWGPDLFGRAQNQWRVVRTSNGYAFIDPNSKSEFPTGTSNQDFILSLPHPQKRQLDPDSPLGRALIRLGAGLKAAEGERSRA